MSRFRTPFIVGVHYLLGFIALAAGGIWMSVSALAIFATARPDSALASTGAALVLLGPGGLVLYSGLLTLTIGYIAEQVARSAFYSRESAALLEQLVSASNSLPGPDKPK